MSSTQQLFHNVAIVGATGPGLGNALVEAFLSNKVFNVNVRFLYREESAKVRGELGFLYSPIC
jgi:hypothetical protein